MGTMYAQRNMRFFDTPQMVNLDAKKGKMMITPDRIRRIRGNIHFIVDAGSTEAVNTNTEITKWKTVLDLISQNQPPFDNLTQESKDKIAKRVLYALKVSDADELVEREVVQNPNQVQGQVMDGLSPAEQTAVTAATGEQNAQQNQAVVPQDSELQQTNPVI